MENLEISHSASTSGKPRSLTLDEKGRPILPADTARRYGLRPGVATYFEEGEHALLLHRPSSHLAKGSNSPHAPTLTGAKWLKAITKIVSAMLFRPAEAASGHRASFSVPDGPASGA